MRIAVLDAATLGEDIQLEEFFPYADVIKYPNTAPEEVPERIKGFDVIIINKIKITGEVLDQADALKLICVAATGYDNIDLAECRRHGVAVANVPGYSSHSVAQVTVATVLFLYNRIESYRNFVISGDYYASKTANRLVPQYREIYGKTWGIVGYGGIGKEVAKAAEALGCRVIVNKRVPTAEAECVEIDELCQRSDIISIHCPLTQDTRGLINRERIASMKDGVVLVNEARGLVVDEDAVRDAVLSGKIGGFGCDVYSTEPFGPDHPYESIKALENVLLTPHMAWGAYESRVRCFKIISENILSHFNGGNKNRVDINK